MTDKKHTSPKLRKAPSRGESRRKLKGPTFAREPKSKAAISTPPVVPRLIQPKNQCEFRFYQVIVQRVSPDSRQRGQSMPLLLSWNW